MTIIEGTIRQADSLPTSGRTAVMELDRPLISQATYKSLDTALGSIFPTPAEETKVQKARMILQEVATDLTDEEVEIFITELQCLVESWFDVYEKQAFDGLTLKELLKGG